MKYTKEQHLDIGRRIYSGEINRYQAAEIYDISDQTAREYMRLYRNVNHLPPKRGRPASANHSSISKTALESKDLEACQSMSKEELIQELVKARIAEVRLKKGYEVKGDGSVIRYVNKNTR
jgi:transposase